MIVLIIERTEDTARAYAKALCHYDVHICTDPATALEYLEKLKPDALVFNLSALYNVAQLPYRPRITIGLTFFVSNQIMEWARTIGITDMVRLPCTPKQLAMQLDKLLCVNV